jgi:mannose-6-phosphate isomerase-like protein (cupin superfamily)
MVTEALVARLPSLTVVSSTWVPRSSICAVVTTFPSFTALGVGLVESRLGGSPWYCSQLTMGAIKLGIMFVKRVSSSAHFAQDKMGKSTVVRGDFLFVGLNAFDPGQEHASHAHEGQDKLYLILEGSGVVQVGEESETLAAGDAAYAPSGTFHSIRNPGPGRLVAMVILAPPPVK